MPGSSTVPTQRLCTSRRSSAGIWPTRRLGQRKAVLFGAVLLTLGHFFMAFEGAPEAGNADNPIIYVFWLALALIIVGSGFLKANISVIVGQLYPRTDVRRDGAYTIFYMGINLGAAHRLAAVRLHRRDLWMGLRFRSCRHRHAAWPRSVHLGQAAAARPGRAAQGAGESTRIVASTPSDLRSSHSAGSPSNTRMRSASSSGPSARRWYVMFSPLPPSSCPMAVFPGRRRQRSIPISAAACC